MKVFDVRLQTVEEFIGISHRMVITFGDEPTTFGSMKQIVMAWKEGCDTTQLASGLRDLANKLEGIS